MNPRHEFNDQASPAEPKLATLLMTDLVDFTSLVERLGDVKAEEVLSRHHSLVRELLRERNGREIDQTDGFLLMFERPIRPSNSRFYCMRNWPTSTRS